MRAYGWTQSNMTSVLSKKSGHRHTQTEGQPCEDTLTQCGDRLQAKEKRPLHETKSVDTLNLNFQLPKFQKKKKTKTCCLSHTVCDIL